MTPKALLAFLAGKGHIKQEQNQRTVKCVVLVPIRQELDKQRQRPASLAIPGRTRPALDRFRQSIALDVIPVRIRPEVE